MKASSSGIKLAGKEFSQEDVRQNKWSLKPFIVACGYALSDLVLDCFPFPWVGLGSVGTSP